ncbi:hypothetical protein HanPSC8_Chr17g0775911 [Helianthus annuus]|nr:hypothetical protein HanPSC8_Chr17g0775911 [Helianthus annuus]
MSYCKDVDNVYPDYLEQKIVNDRDLWMISDCGLMPSGEQSC